ncbi:MAG: rod-binding protein [Beijerinckiaceae bacterium]|nr:rod-binding protein [Beijerinckiaceae bacterium]
MTAHILPQNSALAGLGQTTPPDGNTSKKAKTAWAAAQNFESIFIKNLYSQAFSGVKGEGPLGTDGAGAETWRDLLVDEYAKSSTRSGGIGIAKDVYRELLQVQERAGAKTVSK